MYRSKKEMDKLSEVSCVGKAQGESQSMGKPAAMILAASAAMTAGVANAAIDVPQSLLDVFTDLAQAFGVLVIAGATLFGVIRGGIALFKIASRIFSAAGA